MSNRVKYGQPFLLLCGSARRTWSLCVLSGDVSAPRTGSPPRALPRSCASSSAPTSPVRPRSLARPLPSCKCPLVGAYPAHPRIATFSAALVASTPDTGRARPATRTASDAFCMR